MPYVYDLFKNSFLLQSILLFWSLYGIYLAIVKNGNNKKVRYQISKFKKKNKSLIFWYCGKRKVYFRNNFKYRVKFEEGVFRFDVSTNCKIEDIKYEDNQLIISTDTLSKGDAIELKIYGDHKTPEFFIVEDGDSPIDFSNSQKWKNILLNMFIFLYVLWAFFGASTSFINITMNRQMSDFVTLVVVAKEYGVYLEPDFREEYFSIIAENQDEETQNKAIIERISEIYGENLPTMIFSDCQNYKINALIQSIFELICMTGFIAFCIDGDMQSDPPLNLKLIEIYSMQLKGNSIGVKRLKNKHCTKN